MNPLIIAPLFDIAGKVFDRIFPDKTQAEKAKLELLQLAQTQDFQIALEQIKTNAAEAASGSKYAAGWRPSIGYIGAAGLAYQFLLYPLLTWGAALLAPEFAPPPLQTEELMTLVWAMLGLGTLRTAEKIKRKA